MTKSASPTFRNRLEFWLARGLTRMVTLFPAGLTVNIAAAAGVVIARVAPIRRSTIRQNLRIAFGDSISHEERSRLEREAYKSLMMLAVESLYLQSGDNDWVNSRVVEVRGQEHLDAVRARTPTWIHTMGHMGNWELAGAWQSLRVPVLALAKPMHNPLMQADLERTRAAGGIQILWSSQPDVPRELVRGIRAGKVLGIMVDQDMRGEGIFVPFFGRPASTTSLPAVLADRYKIPIVPACLVRLGPTRHRVECWPPIWPEDYAHLSREERIEAITRKYTEVLEDIVRLYPAQYFWFHRRWKSTPEAIAKHQAKMNRKRQEARPATDEP